MSEVIEFSITIPLANTPPVDVTFQDPPGGAWEAEITDAREVTADEQGGSGKKTLRFQASIIEEPIRGLSTQLVIGTDWEAGKRFNARHARNLCEGLHTAEGKYIPPEALNKALPVTRAMFVGKRCFILVKSAAEGAVDDQGRPARADKNFITKGMYENAKRAMLIGNGATAATGAHLAAAAVSRPAAAPMPASPAAAPPPPPAAGVDLNNLFA
jgi:hypothetical protein